jgi:transglutaminase-like putative cysteine protease
MQPRQSILGVGKMRLLTVRHITSYRYRQPVAFGEHRMMLRPRDSYDQKLIEARLAITPEPAALRWVHDVFGNCVAIARFNGAATELRVDSTIRLDHSPSNSLDFELEDYARVYPFSYSAEESCWRR